MRHRCGVAFIILLCVFFTLLRFQVFVGYYSLGVITSPTNSAVEEAKNEPFAIDNRREEHWLKNKKKRRFCIDANDFSIAALGLYLKEDDVMSKAEVIGAIKFQQFIYSKQFPKVLLNNTKLYSHVKNHRYGFFSQIQGLIHSLLESLANDHVFVWDDSKTFYANSCPSKNFECFFLPVTNVSEQALQTHSLHYEVKRNVRTSCAFERRRRRMKEWAFPNQTQVDIIPQLIKKIGLDETRKDIFSPHFFLRESLRFITRPNVRLIKLTRLLLAHELQPPLDWVPLRHKNKVVSVFARFGADRSSQGVEVFNVKYYVTLVKTLAFSNSGDGIDQVLFTSDNSSSYATFAKLLNVAENQEDEDREKRQKNGTIRVSFVPLELFASFETIKQEATFVGEYLHVEIDDGLLLLAQSFIFSQTDFLIGSFASNILNVIHLMKGVLMNEFPFNYHDVNGGVFVPCSLLSPFPLKPIGYNKHKYELSN